MKALSKITMSGLVLFAATTATAGAQTEEQWWVSRPGVQTGQIEERAILSKIYGRERKISVYTPPGYPAAQTAYDVMYVFDSADYQADIPLPVVLNNLLASGKIGPMVAVLIDNTENRLGDLANHEEFARFMAEEVVPFARKSWKITSDPQHTIVAGYSAGGLAAAYMGFMHPELFGNVLSQSGAFWRGNEGASQPYEWLTSQFTASAKKPLRFYVEVGGDETHRALGSGPVFIEANRRLRDALHAKGYEVDYVEVPGAKHNPEHWRAQLGDALISLTATWKNAGPKSLSATGK